MRSLSDPQGISDILELQANEITEKLMALLRISNRAYDFQLNSTL